MTCATIQKEKTILDLMYTRAHTHPERGAIAHLQGDNWQELTFRTMQERALKLSEFLISLGIRYGEKIAILSESSPEWGIIFFAAIRTGAIVVPLDPKATVEEIDSILHDCSPRVLFTSPDQLDKALKVYAKNTALDFLFLTKNKNGQAGITDLNAQPHLSGRNRPADETALIVYTSGTTGSAKGVMLSFDTVVFQMQNIERMLKSNTQDVFLSVLPMNHVLELVCGFLAPLYFGAKICYAPSMHPQEIFAAMESRQVTWMYVVPNLLRLLKSSLVREFKSDFNPAMRSKFGKDFKGFVCGGAPLDNEVESFFQKLNLTVLQGYGLTETGPTVATNSPTESRFGTVGKAMPGVELKISAALPGNDEGEILTRGPHLMQGYHNKPELTQMAIDADGWFHTGDLGKLDADGFLTVTGRVKNLIVLGSGKKVQPEEVEEALKTAPFVKDLIVLAQTCGTGTFSGTPELVAVVAPTREFEDFLNEDKPAAEMELRDQLMEASQRLAPFKRPRKVYLHKEDFARTSSNKVKREQVALWLKEKEPIKSWI